MHKSLLGDEMGDMEQHNSSPWQDKCSGKEPGLGQKEQHPWDCGWERRKRGLGEPRWSWLLSAASVAKLLPG